MGLLAPASLPEGATLVSSSSSSSLDLESDLLTILLSEFMRLWPFRRRAEPPLLRSDVLSNEGPSAMVCGGVVEEGNVDDFELPLAFWLAVAWFVALPTFGLGGGRCLGGSDLRLIGRTRF